MLSPRAVHRVPYDLHDYKTSGKLQQLLHIIIYKLFHSTKTNVTSITYWNLSEVFFFQNAFVETLTVHFETKNSFDTIGLLYIDFSVTTPGICIGNSAASSRKSLHLFVQGIEVDFCLFLRLKLMWSPQRLVISLLSSKQRRRWSFHLS